MPADTGMDQGALDLDRLPVNFAGRASRFRHLPIRLADLPARDLFFLSRADGVFEGTVETVKDGNELYHKACNECLKEHRELMVEVWSPTPWMLDVLTEGRDQEIWNWCRVNFGCESSPIHGKQGRWHRANVTMLGRTWFGFENEALLELFKSQFPSPTKHEDDQRTKERAEATEEPRVASDDPSGVHQVPAVDGAAPDNCGG